MNFFDMDGPLYKIGTVIADIFMLSFLWIIFSIPLLTIGASTTAVYYVSTKKATGSDSYVLKGFLKSFKENLLISTIVFIILVIIGFVVWINYRALGEVEMGFLYLPVRLALIIVTTQLVFVSMYVFPIISRFNVTVRNALKFALQLSNVHLFFSLSNVVLFVAIIFVTMWVPALFIFIPGIFAHFSASLFVKIFRKHNPEF